MSPSRTRTSLFAAFQRSKRGSKRLGKRRIRRLGTRGVESLEARLCLANVSFSLTPEELANSLLGDPDITISNVSLIGGTNGSNTIISAGSFTGGIADGIGIEAGVILSTGDAASALGPNDSDGTTTDFSTPGDSDLENLLAGLTTNDATVLEFDLTLPAPRTISFEYVFASEEYNEFVDSNFNDVFGFFLDGSNIALIPGTSTPVAINNVNSNVNPSFYNNNDMSDVGSPTPFLTEYDGFTTVLEAIAVDLSAGTHRLKLAIADASDTSLDSVVFLRGQSLGSGEADLRISKTDNPDPVMIDDQLTYTLTVNNDGPQDATGVVAMDTLPGGVTFVSASSSQGTVSHNNGVVTADIGTLASGGSATISIQVTAPSVEGVIVNEATVFASQFDPDRNNNSLTESTTVVEIIEPDLSLSKTELQDPVLSGGDIRYTLNVSNIGGNTATNVVLTDTLPAGVTFVSADPTQGICSEDVGIVTCNLGDLTAGTSAQVTLVVTTTVAGPVTNSASVSSDVNDADPTNNSATESTVVERFEDAFNRISGTKWQDLNENGTRESNEPPLSGVTVYLDLNNNGTHESFEPSQVTDSNGFYQFEKLASGTYFVREITPSGFQQSFPPTGFSQSTNYFTGTLIGDVATGDLNGDQLMDVIVANDYSDPSQFQSSLTVLLNDGQGGFSESTISLPNNARPQGVYVGDLLGNSLPDIAVTSLGLPAEPSSDTNGVLVLENLGSGSYSSPQFFAVGNGPTAIAGADFNLDGIMDLVTANHLSDNISVLLGQSGGGYDSAISIGVGDAPLSLAVADLNQDDTPDLAVGNFNDGTVSLLINSANGGSLFNDPLVVNNIGSPRDVEIADFDGNGTYDVAAISFSTGELHIGFNDGNGSFNVTSTSVVSGPVSLAVGELTGDSAPDLVIGSLNGSINFFSNSGSGIFGSPEQVTLPAFSIVNSLIPIVPESLALANVDTSQGLDVIVGHFAGGVSVHPFSPGAHVVTIGLTDTADGNDFGNFSVVSFLLSEPASPEGEPAWDVNNDGELTPSDALIVINHLNEMEEPTAEAEGSWELDVNGDNAISPIDALLIINRLNALAQPLEVTHQLDGEQLRETYEAAIAIWAEAGLESIQLERLRDVDLIIGQLSDSVLASVSQNIIAVDTDAGGSGWFVDSSPLDNAEFAAGAGGLDLMGGDYVDLLTTLLHEQAHLLGLDHDTESGLLADALQAGQRYLPTAADIDAVLATLG